MLGDALATEDPQLLAQALVSYPVKPYGEASRSLYKELFRIAGGEIKPGYARAVEFL